MFINMEKWKDVIGYEGLYQISNHGRVKHLTQIHKNRFGECTKQEHIVGYKGSNGYMYVVLHKNNKPHTVTIHSLVAKAFIPNPNGYDCINHKDETRDNNIVENLEWCDKSYNNNYGTIKERRSIIMNAHPSTSKKVVCTQKDGKEVFYPSARFAAKQLGINPSNIINCCNGKQKTCKGMKFSYIEQGLALEAPVGMYNFE